MFIVYVYLPLSLFLSRRTGGVATTICCACMFVIQNLKRNTSVVFLEAAIADVCACYVVVNENSKTDTNCVQ